MKIILIVAFALFACGKSASPPPQAKSEPAAKSPATAKQLIGEGAVVIDVRTPQEFAEGHLPMATNIPVQEFATRIAEVDKLVSGDHGKPVVVYCAAGKRAAKAKEQLDAAGYTHVVNGGGYDDLR